MAKAKTCSKCTDPRVDGQPFCAPHYAEYMREYRDRADKKRDNDNYYNGFRDGVAKAVATLRGKIGGSPMTGFQAAVILERSYLMPQAPGVADRQKLIASMRPIT
jgi:hypothetical protein